MVTESSLNQGRLLHRIFVYIPAAGMDVFKAERIVEKRIYKGHIQYLVKWHGYSKRYNTWEPRRNILDEGLIREFNKRVVETGGGFLLPDASDRRNGAEVCVPEDQDSAQNSLETCEITKPENGAEVCVLEDQGSAQSSSWTSEITKPEDDAMAVGDPVSDCISSEDEWTPQKKGRDQRRLSCNQKWGASDEKDSTEDESDSTSEEDRSAATARRSRQRRRQTQTSPRKRKSSCLSPAAAFKSSCHHTTSPSSAEHHTTCPRSPDHHATSPSSPDHHATCPRSPSRNTSRCTTQARKKSCRARKRKEESKRRRRKVQCPVDTCNGSVINLPRHFHQIHHDIPRHEAHKLIQKLKKPVRRNYPVVNCTIQNCTWKGTRPDKHLISKAHRFEKAHAKKIAKQIRLAQTVQVPAHGRNMHSAKSLSEDFLDWFESIEGGNYIPEFLSESKKAQRSKQNKKYKGMIETVLRTCLGRGEFHKSALEQLDSIGKRTGNSSKSVVEELQEGKSWGTVKNYLCAFSHFIDFLETRKPLLVEKDSIASIRLSLKGCIQTVTKFALEEQQRRKLLDRNKVISFTDIKQYLEMNIADSLTKSFEVDTADSDENLRDRVHRIGKHLLLELAIQNAKRTGIFNDMTCKELDEAVEEDGGYVVMVAEGKTFRVAGASGVFCSAEEYRRLKYFVSDLRPYLKPSTNQVFCRRTGEYASVSESGEFIREAWVDFGSIISKDVGDLTFTLIRKTIVSKSRQEGVTQDTQEEMARHMDHSRDTANKYYDTSTGARLTASFRRTFTTFYDPLESDENGSEEEDAFPPSDKLADVGRSRAEESMNKVSSEPKAWKCSDGAEAQARKYTFGKADVFTDNDKARLYRCCADLIEKYRKRRAGEQGVTRGEILAGIRSAGPNFSDLLKNYTLAQICNRVRCELRKKK